MTPARLLRPLALLALTLAIPAAASAQGLAPGDLVILSSADAKLIRIARQDGAVSNYFTLSGIGILIPRSIAVAPNGDVYLCQDGRVTKLDTSLALSPVVQDTLINDPTGCVFTSEALYVVSNDDSSVVRVDLATEDVTVVADEDAFATASGATGLNPVSIFDLELQGDVLYVSDYANYVVYSVQLPGGAVEAWSFGSDYVHRIAVSPSRIFVSTGAQDEVVGMSLPTHQLLGVLAGDDADRFHVMADIEHDPATDTLWLIGSELDDVIFEIDPATGVTLDEIPVGGLPGEEKPFDLELVPAPEPTALLAQAIALATLAALRSRRR